MRRPPITAIASRASPARSPTLLGLGPMDATEVELVAVLHDVGKLTIDPDLLDWEGPLDDVQRARLRRHTIAGEELLAEIAGLEHLAARRARDARGVGRQRLPGRPRGRRDPAHGADRHGRRLVRRDDQRPRLPHAPCRTARRAAGCAAGPARSSTRTSSTPCCASSASRCARRLVEWTCARAARGRDHRAAPGCGDARRGHRVRAGAGHQRAEDVRPAAARARGRARSRASGGAASTSSSTSPATCRCSCTSCPPGACSSSTSAPRCATARRGCSCGSPAPGGGGRARAAPARVRHEAGGVGQGAARSRARGRGGAGHARPRGVAGPAAAGRAARRAGRAAAARGAARPARDLRHRALVGRRDPVDGDAVAVQARRRPRRRRGRGAAHGDR